MTKHQIILLLKFCAFFVFIGRAYEHLFWDAPYRALLWDQNLLQSFVENVFNMTWKEYVTSLRADTIIQTTIKINGLIYAICAVISLVITQNSKKILKIILGFGAALLLLLALLLSKSKFYHAAMFFEHAIQFGTPFMLLYLFRAKGDLNKLTLPLKIMTAVTFASHGLYALGSVYPLPANFVTMVLNILPVTENIAKDFLTVAGILDFVIVVLIFIPKLQRIGIIYAIAWGLATALARIVNGLTYDISFSIIHQYLYATVYRLPHGLVPLIIFMIINLKRKNTVEVV